MFKKFSLPVFILLALGQPVYAATDPYALSPQLYLLGLTPAIQASAKNGAGVIFGDIDTGITQQWIGFGYKYNSALAYGTNNIDLLHSAECLKGVCPVVNRDISNSEGGSPSKYMFPTDGNGHGTFTASELVGGVQGAGLVSLDPAAKVIAVQVLDANGGGTFTDVSNGIRYAVNSGAKILNLSLGPNGGTPTQLASAYTSMASAVNYAASKGVVIVFAGGNASQPFAGGANITGFSDLALTHMMLVGSTDATETVSTFSDTPGTGHFITTSGKTVDYTKIWLMADGENIWGASNYHTSSQGYSFIQQDSGTSMAAPQIAGLAGLLAARWPSLLTKGTIPAILEASSSDLGGGGIDGTYGNGFVSVTAAFTAIGALSVPVGSGSTPVSLLGALSTATAFGNMSGVANALSNASIYDSFGRDFSANLGTVITTKASSVALSEATIRVSGQGGAGTRTFTQTDDGAWFAFSGTPGQTEWTSNTTAPPGLTQDPTRPSQNNWSIGFQQGNGTYVGAGQGSGAALSFNDARWGGKTAFFNSDDSMGGTLLGLTDTANYSSVGFNNGKDAHFSIGVMSTQADDFTSLSGQQASAYGAAIGYTTTPSEKLTLSWTGSFLDEKNMLLGSPASGYLSLGQASTMSFGMGANMKLGSGLNLGLDTIVTTTNPSSNQASLIAGTSRLYSAGFSVALNEENLTGNDDTLGVSMKKPLRVYGGSANVNVPQGSDINGNPIIHSVGASLVPTGSETDLGLDYLRPLAGNASASFSMAFRNDADNIAGAQDAAAMAHYRLKF